MAKVNKKFMFLSSIGIYGYLKSYIAASSSNKQGQTHVLCSMWLFASVLNLCYGMRRWMNFLGD